MVTKLNTDQFLQHLTTFLSKYCIVFNSLPEEITVQNYSALHTALNLISEFRHFLAQNTHDPLLPPVAHVNKSCQVINTTLRIQNLEDSLVTKIKAYPNVLVCHIPPS
jgi:hypothetical protein